LLAARRTSSGLLGPAAAAVAVAVVIVAALVALRAGAHTLIATPRLYGANFDVWGTLALDADAKMARLVADPRTEAVAPANVAGAVVEGHDVGLLALGHAKGALLPVIAEGRAPVAADEILLGSRTLAAIGRRVGATVHVDAGRGPRALRVVGRAVLP